MSQLFLSQKVRSKRHFYSNPTWTEEYHNQNALKNYQKCYFLAGDMLSAFSFVFWARQIIWVRIITMEGGILKTANPMDWIRWRFWVTFTFKDSWWNTKTKKQALIMLLRVIIIEEDLLENMSECYLSSPPFLAQEV